MGFNLNLIRHELLIVRFRSGKKLAFDTDSINFECSFDKKIIDLPQNN